MPLSAGSHLAAKLSDAGTSIDWAEDLCQGRCAGSSEEDVITRKMRNTKQNNPHDQTRKREKTLLFGRAHSHFLQLQKHRFQHGPPSASSVTPSTKNELGQRCVYINAAAGNHPGGDGAGGGFCDNERRSRLRRHQDTFDAEGCDGSHKSVRQDQQR